MKLTEVIRRYNYAWDAHYAEALVNLFRQGGAPTSYNGLNALPDRTIVVKSLYRVEGAIRTGPPRC
jgi:hypothetical protein